MNYPVNPYKLGAGHRPPYLAGRQTEKQEFLKLLDQEVILENFIITGLRGLGKTVLLDELKPYAVQKNWLWIGNDLSETVSVSENNLAIRIITDLSIITSRMSLHRGTYQKPGFTNETIELEDPVDYQFLLKLYENTPGLVSDKLKVVLDFVYEILPETNKKIIFAYDEAQNLSDNAGENEYPLSVLLDIFQSIQKKGIPFMLVFVGLPTLLPKLVDARTYSERMFRVVVLSSLNEEESKEAVLKPLHMTEYKVLPNDKRTSYL